MSPQVKLKFSDGPGREIAIKPGVGLAYLLAGDVTAPIADKEGETCAKALFGRLATQRLNSDEASENHVVAATSFTLAAGAIVHAALATVNLLTFRSRPD